MKYYVSNKAITRGNGTEQHPFSTISGASAFAKPGDEIIVLPGTYRECVSPPVGGTSDSNRITYRSQIPGKAIITGAEIISNWTKLENDVWVTRVPNSLFNNYNPYTNFVQGDWLIKLQEYHHTGEVYLNGRSLYEVNTLDAVYHPVVTLGSHEPEQSLFKWYCTQEADCTVIYANFGTKDPTAECVEINVRNRVFFPEETGINYITVSGFVLKQAATEWAPPTAFQDGLIGPHWSKGWIIEDCYISDSKCSGISLGKCWHPNNNKWSNSRVKSGPQNERDLILYAQHTGWNKETVGSHIVRRNTIKNCGQAGIIGHLGCIFSLIEDNHIYDIVKKFEFDGAELGGIKLHAAIDTIIRRNYIHHAHRGIWLDWQAQGTRVSQNILAYNTGNAIEEKFSTDYCDDLHIEVSHGPTLVDNNIFLSPFAILNRSHGVAFVHNIIAGAVNAFSVFGRYTPYHFPHHTDVAGFMTFMFGDCRFYNNMFIQNTTACKCLVPDTSKNESISVIEARAALLTEQCGLSLYDDYPTFEEYQYALDNPTTQTPFGPGFNYDAKLPIACQNNVYFNGATAYAKEKENFMSSTFDTSIQVSFTADACTIDSNIFKNYADELRLDIISSEVLGIAFEPEQRFENNDGTSIYIDIDIFGENRPCAPTPGAIERSEQTHFVFPAKGASYASTIQ